MFTYRGNWWPWEEHLQTPDFEDFYSHTGQHSIPLFLGKRNLALSLWGRLLLLNLNIRRPENMAKLYLKHVFENYWDILCYQNMETLCSNHDHSEMKILWDICWSKEISNHSISRGQGFSTLWYSCFPATNFECNPISDYRVSLKVKLVSKDKSLGGKVQWCVTLLMYIELEELLIQFLHNVVQWTIRNSFVNYLKARFEVIFSLTSTSCTDTADAFPWLWNINGVLNKHGPNSNDTHLLAFLHRQLRLQ